MPTQQPYITQTNTDFSLSPYQDDEKIFFTVDISSTQLNSQSHQVIYNGKTIYNQDGKLNQFLELGYKKDVINKNLISIAIIRKIPNNPNDIDGLVIDPELLLTAIYKFKGDLNKSETGFLVPGENPGSVIEDFNTIIKLKN